MLVLDTAGQPAPFQLRAQWRENLRRSSGLCRTSPSRQT